MSKLVVIVIEGAIRKIRVNFKEGDGKLTITFCFTKLT